MKGVRYEIRIQGRLSPDWADWFEGMEILQEADGHTLLEGPVVDQAALHGLLERLRDLNLTLISVNPTAAETSPAKSDRPAAGSRERGE